MQVNNSAVHTLSASPRGIVQLTQLYCGSPICIRVDQIQYWRPFRHPERGDYCVVTLVGHDKYVEVRELMNDVTSLIVGASR